MRNIKKMLCTVILSYQLNNFAIFGFTIILFSTLKGFILKLLFTVALNCVHKNTITYVEK